jgi:hypothetical protein
MEARIDIDERTAALVEVFMRKALLVIGICVLAAPAWAGGGFSLFGAYSEVNDDASAPGAGVRLSVGGENWLGDLTWTWFENQDDVVTIAGIEDGIQVVPTDLGVRYLFDSRGSAKLYVGAGVTFFYVNLDDGNVDNAIGGYAMAGFNFGHGRTMFFAEAIYRYGSTDVSYGAADSISGSMDVGGFGANVGVVVGF